jgi:hypothetical protein
MPYSMAGIALALNYGEQRTALLIPLEGEEREGVPPPTLVTSYIARQLSAGRKVMALMRQPPDTSLPVVSDFDLRPAFSGEISFFHLPQVQASQLPRSTAEARFPYRAFDVYARGTAPVRKVESSRDDLSRVLSAGLDFTKPELPPVVIAMTGLSYVEAPGRWTDGPVARLQFAHALPERFLLEIDVSQLYARDRSVPLKVIVGNQAKDMYLPEGAGTVRLDFAPEVPADAIEIRIPDPVSPKSGGVSADPRLLGIRLKSLRVIAAQASTAPQDNRSSLPAAVPWSEALATGIDFTKPNLPDLVASLEGISKYEPPGRWTDGAVARVQLRRPLPRRFTLEIIVADVYEPNRGEPITVRVGSEAKRFALQRGPETFRFAFAPTQPVDAVVFDIPRPTSPASRGEGVDHRRVGIRLKSLRFIESDAGPGSQSGKEPVPAVVVRSQDVARDIDFTKPNLPDLVAAVDGISKYEPRGRWTDGPVARVRLRDPLPRRFTLEIDVADLYEPNRGQPITVRVGGETKQFTLQRAPQTIRFSFVPAQPSDSIALGIPRPTSPASRGEGDDTRQVGIRLQAIRILPAER